MAEKKEEKQKVAIDENELDEVTGGSNKYPKLTENTINVN